MEIEQILQCDIFHKDKQEELIKFLHACIDELCTSVGPIYRKFSNVDWSKETFNNIRTFILLLFKKPCCLYTEEEKMPEEFHEFPEHVKKAILCCLRVRKTQLTDALLFKYSSEHVPTLLNFDWRLKYVMGSSKMASIKEPLMQLDLIIQDKTNEEIFELELNKDELQSIISTLETIIT